MKENIILSTSTSNSSFLNGNIDGNFTDMDDRMTILDCETRENYHKPMSKTRKMAFIASIVSTILVVIVFLLLPCNKNCVAKHHITRFTKTINWISNYDDIEFKGIINTIRSNEENSPLNLVFMYRENKIFSSTDPKSSKQKFNGGIIQLDGNSGKIVWKNEMKNEPLSIDCSLIDCNKDEKTDCLIIDNYGQLNCVDNSGHWVYYTSNSNTMKLDQKRQEMFNFPLIIPDLNNDKVYEIIMSNYKANTTYLSLISGSNAKLLGEELQNCFYIDRLELDTDYVIKFICILKNNTEQQIFKNLTDFNGSMPKTKKLQSVPPIAQHKYPDKFATINAQAVTINVENSGSWPRDSKSRIKLTSFKNGVKKTLYNQTGNKTYVFNPVKFSINTKSSKENIHGFVVKYWVWNGTEISFDIEKSKVKREAKRIEKAVKAQKSNYTNQTNGNVYKTKFRYLQEIILLIVLNSTHIDVENKSQSNIVQFCHTDSKRNENTVCQPDLKYQENSLIIADIDNDGCTELVSFSSTFKYVNQSETSQTNFWKLKTFIQLFKLETEWPKLYRSDYDMF